MYTAAGAAAGKSKVGLIDLGHPVRRVDWQVDVSYRVNKPKLCSSSSFTIWRKGSSTLLNSSKVTGSKQTFQASFSSVLPLFLYAKTFINNFSNQLSSILQLGTYKAPLYRGERMLETSG